jgi:hypothetical protein
VSRPNQTGAVSGPHSPDYNEDRLGHFAGVAHHIYNEDAELRQGFEVIVAGQQIAKRADEFKRTHPDYKGASEVLSRSGARDLGGHP